MSAGPAHRTSGAVYPSPLAVAALAIWSAAAVAAVYAPPLLALLVLAGLVLLAAALGDAVAVARIAAPLLERRLPPHAWLGRACDLELLVHERSGRALLLELIDELPRDFALEVAAAPTLAPAVSGAAAHGSAPPAVGGDVRVGPLQLAPRATLEVCVRVRPRRRGLRPLGTPIALLRSPLGLWRRRVEGPAGARLLVRPDTSRLLRRETLDPRRVLAQLGVKPARRRGEGTEFEALREYVPGDDPRHIDWKASARRGRPTTRVHRHERNHTVILAVDASRLMAARSQRGDDPFAPTKLDHAIEAALALACTALAHKDRVGLVVFDDALRGYLAPRAHRTGLGAMIDLLALLQPRRVEADHAELVSALAARQRQRALVVVLTDFVEAESERFSTPFAVLARRHATLLVALRDPLHAEVDGLGPRAAPVRDPGQRAEATRHRAPTLLELHRRIVIDDLLLERETALLGLRRAGVQTLDLAPQEVTAPLLNRYLALRHGPER